jgi:hypothetical protein
MRRVGFQLFGLAQYQKQMETRWPDKLKMQEFQPKTPCGARPTGQNIQRQASTDRAID